MKLTRCRIYKYNKLKHPRSVFDVLLVIIIFQFPKHEFVKGSQFESHESPSRSSVKLSGQTT